MACLLGLPGQEAVFCPLTAYHTIQRPRESRKPISRIKSDERQTYGTLALPRVRPRASAVWGKWLIVCGVESGDNRLGVPRKSESADAGARGVSTSPRQEAFPGGDHLPVIAISSWVYPCIRALLVSSFRHPLEGVKPPALEAPCHWMLTRTQSSSRVSSHVFLGTPDSMHF